jgi:hypothetical protein
MSASPATFHPFFAPGLTQPIADSIIRHTT